ncbi:arylsulfatase [Colwellia piezophila]|uniref:arylsulfatase n=1 Tax=Colwellia piezophila TaxID=211668 RepID=UPI00037D5728|nr:arylsulfatase [Colwellia piezophila]
MSHKSLKSLLLIFGAMITLIGCGSNSTSAVAVKTPSPQKTNIIYILADDMGYGDLGAYGQEKILTPNIDKLALEGIKFTQHYSGSTVCAPSRSVLLTGLHSGHTQVRGNYTLGGYNRWGKNIEQGQIPLKSGTQTIANMLQNAGYTTAVIGKWGLGGPTNNIGPNDFGFDYFYGYLDQKWAHNYYPPHVWENKEKVVLDNEFFIPHALIAKTSTKAKDYKQYMGNDYAPELMTDAALKFIDRNADKPFFLYYSALQPHAAIQIPDEDLKPYDDKAWLEPAMDMTKKVYTPHPRPRAARAAMITDLDRDVGLMLQRLEELGLADNTLVIFASDNGPTGAGGQDLAFFNSTKGLKGEKRDLYEGGIRVPMIARWPGKIPANTTTDVISAFWDIAPTLAQVAQVPGLTRVDGMSLIPYMQEPNKTSDERVMYWEFSEKLRGSHGQQAIRLGQWKAVKRNAIADANAPIELYNLTDDIGETNNVAAKHPEIVAKMKKLMTTQRTPTPVEKWQFPTH